MSGFTWASSDMVLAGQLLSAAALAVHLLVLRPRGARQDLLLDARIVQDELDLAERLGQVPATQVETIAIQQLLRRIRQNPRSARLVLERIPALALAARQSIRPTDLEYLAGALDRLSDAAQRYLRGAWPRAGALTPAFSIESATGWGSADPHDIDRPAADRDEGEVPPWAEAGYRSDGEEDLADGEYDDEFEDESYRGTYGVQGPDRDDDLDHDLGADPDGDPYEGDEPVRITDVELARITGDEPVPTTDFELARITGDEPVPTTGDDSARAALPAWPGQAPPRGDLPARGWAPTWVDLVQAESPARAAGRNLADRHARPYRPVRSSAHASSHRIEPPDRSSVLPR